MVKVATLVYSSMFALLVNPRNGPSSETRLQGFLDTIPVSYTTSAYARNAMRILTDVSRLQGDTAIQTAKWVSIEESIAQFTVRYGRDSRFSTFALQMTY